MVKHGEIILIGAGPGDAGLLTLRGLEELQSAEVVLYDRLVGDGILALIPSDAERVDVGKQGGNHTLPQHEINALLLSKAHEGKRVVRLKGGDPYLFGRGAEELQELEGTGIPFSVIPGVSASIAAPAWAGIPVTHREHASSVHIVTGHHKQGSEREIPYKALAGTGGTLVFMMAVSALDEICDGLIDAGMDAETPAALVENGTLPCQRKLIGTLKTLTALAAAEKFHPPSALVVGGVCGLSPSLDWRAKLPLAGHTVAVTHPYSVNGDNLMRKLRGWGCGAVMLPCINRQRRRTPEISRTMDSLGQYGWIVFTSAFGVQLFFTELRERGMDIRRLAAARFAAVGSRTALELEKYGVYADYFPDIHTAAHLAKGLVEQINASACAECKNEYPAECACGSRHWVLLYRAAMGTPSLPETLREHGVIVDDIAAYDTLYAEWDKDSLRERLIENSIGVLTFASASAIEGFARAVGSDWDFAAHTAVCIGEETAIKAKEWGFRVVVSDEATMDSLADCIRKVLEKRR